MDSSCLGNLEAYEQGDFQSWEGGRYEDLASSTMRCLAMAKKITQG